MSRYRVQPLDLSGLKTIPIASRGGKVRTADFAAPYAKGSGVAGWLDSLPKILAGDSFRSAVNALTHARQAGKPILWGIGGHVIKCGLAPVLADLMHRGFATSFTMNGAAAIHDARDSLGMGEALCARLCRIADPAFAPRSLLVHAYQHAAPVTVHVAIGTDTPHTHPSADAAAIGATTHRDFRLFCSLLAEINGGGVYLNVGSAVVLPEVFLKAVSAVRNLGAPLADFTTINLDFLQHYRPKVNVVERPHTQAGGRGIALTGHHELMVPLLAAALIECG